jgi:hypothetical protein
MYKTDDDHLHFTLFQDNRKVHIDAFVFEKTDDGFMRETYGTTVLNPPRKLDGFHLSCLRKNGADIPRYGELFAKRARLLGNGRI